MRPEDLITLNEEIAGMARAGLPLDQGLAALAKEMGRGRLHKVTETLARDLREGHTLPEALARQKNRIPAFYAGLVSAGARTGRMSDVLSTLTVYARSLSNLRSIIIDAFFYPAMVVVFATVLFGFMCKFLLPRFDQIFHDFKLQLPSMTLAFMWLAQHPFQAVVLPFLIFVLLCIAANLVIGYRKGGHYHWALFIYSFPIIGTLIYAARLAAFTELLAILIDFETPLPEAFLLAGEASSEPIMAAAARQVHDDLEMGRPLGEVLRGRGLVPEWVSWLTAHGERRGVLGKALHQIAEMYRRQVEMRAGLLSSVLPPILIICTAGLFVSLFAVSMMLPMIKLIEGLSK
jgi:type II secretory pathway component PulF